MSDFLSLSANEQSARLTQLAKNALREWGVTDCDPRLISYRESGYWQINLRTYLCATIILATCSGCSASAPVLTKQQEMASSGRNVLGRTVSECWPINGD